MGMILQQLLLVLVQGLCLSRSQMVMTQSH